MTRFTGADASCRALFEAVVSRLDAYVGDGNLFGLKLSSNRINDGGSTSMMLPFHRNVAAVKVSCIEGLEGVYLCLCQDFYRMRSGGRDGNLQILIQPRDGEVVQEVTCPRPSAFICKRVMNEQDAEDFIRSRIVPVLEIL